MVRKYGNEAEVGRGMSDSGISRDEILLVVKIPARALDRASVAAETEASLRDLGTEHAAILTDQIALGDG